MNYHVSKSGSDTNPGTKELPFFTINKAASVACAGDTVTVHEGLYREWVDPVNGGINNTLRIVYQAAENEHVCISGAERVTGWNKLDNCLWYVIIPNKLFGCWNPYKENVDGDWMILPEGQKPHLGDVFLNDFSLFEAYTLEDCIKAERREFGYQIPGKKPEPIDHPEKTVYQWYAEVDDEKTTIYANFQNIDPNKENVEISVRKCCFYPSKPGVNYLTLKGFEICRAACPFTPPTADQPGMVGAHWSSGWIIENNDIHDAKCSAVSLGRDGSDGHNLYSRFGRKPGYQYQMEAVFLGLKNGWCRGKVGSHIVRNNHIHHCGQNAIVGHMGCAFSLIEHNEIDHIAVKHEFFGWEIAGIKFHAAVDVLIRNNCIHNCTLGTWLDWEAQGTRLTQNVYFDNHRDVMIEVTHGPCLMDNNIFASDFILEDMAQGTARSIILSAEYLLGIRYLTEQHLTILHIPQMLQAAQLFMVVMTDFIITCMSVIMKTYTSADFSDLKVIMNSLLLMNTMTCSKQREILMKQNSIALINLYMLLEMYMQVRQNRSEKKKTVYPE